MRPKSPDVDVARYAEMLTALGAESRLRIMRLLLSAHPDGMVVGDIQKELGLTASNLSHHLEKLKNEELVAVRRDGTFLWYSANAAALRVVSGSGAACCGSAPSSCCSTDPITSNLYDAGEKSQLP